MTEKDNERAISILHSGEPTNLFPKIIFWLSAIFLFIALLLAIFWPATRAYLQAAAVLSQLNGQPVPKLLHPIAAEPITVHQVTISSATGTVSARLYTPVNRPDAPGLVLVPGIHYLGVNEPRLVAFARSLATCGLRVLTPELPDSRDYRINSGDVPAIGDSVQWLQRTTNRPVGLIGLSFSGGLALMAAAKAPYSNQISAILSVGAHDDLYRVAMFYVTGADPLPNGDIVRETANNYGPWILEYEHLEDFTLPADMEAIRSAFRARLYNDPALEKKLTAQLTPSQKAEYAKILDHPSWSLASSNKKHAAEMAALSPHAHLAGLHAPVYLLHGRGDNLIPFAESNWLAQDLPSGDLQQRLVSPLIGHVTTNSNHANLWDRFRLIQILARVLQRVERA